MNDLISVILPCYKAEKYIANIIGDIQAQTYDNFELIIVSNGPDQGEQLQVAQSFAQRDRRIKILTTQTGGVSNARNLGMERAIGDWLAFVDADDRLIPSHLQLMADAADGYDIVIDNTNLNKKVLDNYHALVIAYGNHAIEYKDFFDTPLSVCIERDKNRDLQVTEKVIRSFYNNYKDKYPLNGN